MAWVDMCPRSTPGNEHTKHTGPCDASGAGDVVLNQLQMGLLCDRLDRILEEINHLIVKADLTHHRDNEDAGYTNWLKHLERRIVALEDAVRED